MFSHHIRRNAMVVTAIAAVGFAAASQAAVVTWHPDVDDGAGGTYGNKFNADAVNLWDAVNNVYRVAISGNNLNTNPNTGSSDVVFRAQNAGTIDVTGNISVRTIELQGGGYRFEDGTINFGAANRQDIDIIKSTGDSWIVAVHSFVSRGEGMGCFSKEA